MFSIIDQYVKELFQSPSSNQIQSDLNTLPKELLGVIFNNLSMQNRLQFHQTSLANYKRMSAVDPQLKLLQDIVKICQAIIKGDLCAARGFQPEKAHKRVCRFEIKPKLAENDHIDSYSPLMPGFDFIKENLSAQEIFFNFFPETFSQLAIYNAEEKEKHAKAFQNFLEARLQENKVKTVDVTFNKIAKGKFEIANILLSDYLEGPITNGQNIMPATLKITISR